MSPRRQQRRDCNKTKKANDPAYRSERSRQNRERRKRRKMEEATALRVAVAAAIEAAAAAAVAAAAAAAVTLAAAAAAAATAPAAAATAPSAAPAPVPPSNPHDVPSPPPNGPPNGPPKFSTCFRNEFQTYFSVSVPELTFPCALPFQVKRSVGRPRLDVPGCKACYQEEKEGHARCKHECPRARQCGGKRRSCACTCTYMQVACV